MAPISPGRHLVRAVDVDEATPHRRNKRRPSEHPLLRRRRRLDAAQRRHALQVSDDAADAASGSNTQNDAHLPTAIVPCRDRPSAAAVLEESHFATSVRSSPRSMRGPRRG